MDSKGRMVIPEEVRKELRLVEGSRIRVRVEHDSLVIKKSMEAHEFMKRIEGCLKGGSRVKVEDPLRLKQIWQGQ